MTSPPESKLLNPAFASKLNWGIGAVFSARWLGATLILFRLIGHPDNSINPLHASPLQLIMIVIESEDHCIYSHRKKQRDLLTQSYCVQAMIFLVGLSQRESFSEMTARVRSLRLRLTAVEKRASADERTPPTTKCCWNLRPSFFEMETK